MKNEVIVGIDLGTTNSEVAFVFEGEPRVVKLDDDGIVPSCVGLDGQGRVIVGTLARNQYVAAPERTVVSIKRKMGSNDRVALGRETYSPQEISAFILRALKERAEQVLNREVSKAVITVPAYFSDAQRQATREAGEIAGLEVVRIINEPTAAALAYESGFTGHRKVLIYDLGGGTFDVSIVSFEDGVVEVLASTGDNHLGGDDFDALIVKRLFKVMEEKLGLPAGEDRALQARLRRAAEAAKIELSTRPVSRVQEDHLGEVQGEARHLIFDLYRSEFEEMIEDSLARTMEKVGQALQDALLRPAQLDKILLVGGSTRIPRVAELLRGKLGQEPHGEVDPELCVALGASVQAAIEAGAEARSVLVDITPYTFGTSALGELDGRPYWDRFVPLIRRNSKLPVTQTDLFHTVYEDQEAVDVKVYQGEERDALKNVLIGNFRFPGLNETADASEQGIAMTYHLNLDGILEVHAVERATGKEIRAVVQDAMGRSSQEQLRTSRERVAGRWGAKGAPNRHGNHSGNGFDGKIPPRTEEIIKRVQEVLDSASADDREEMVNLIEELLEAVQNGRLEAAGPLEQKLENILFYVE
ncbi:MAG: Hsp70 family protein [Acidobacteriota bacterium]